MKVYVVMYTWDSGWEYEGHSTYNDVIGVCSTEEKAIKMIKDWVPDDLCFAVIKEDYFDEKNKYRTLYRTFDGEYNESYRVYFVEHELV